VPEDGDDAAVGAEDVAEADGDEFGGPVLEGADDEFGEALGGSHHIGGGDGFASESAVGREGEVKGAEDIVLDGRFPDFSLRTQRRAKDARRRLWLGPLGELCGPWRALREISEAR
jgi:hypothetical protein